VALGYRSRASVASPHPQRHITGGATKELRMNGYSHLKLAICDRGANVLRGLERNLKFRSGRHALPWALSLVSSGGPQVEMNRGCEDEREDHGAKDAADDGNGQRLEHL
jgi:hypothetical protein